MDQRDERDGGNKGGLKEGAKRVLAAVTGAVVAPAAGVVAAPMVSSEVQGIINNGIPAIHASIPAPSPTTQQVLAKIGQEFNVSMGGWADAKSKASEQSAKIDGANKAKDVLKDTSSSPAPKDTSKAASALKGNSSSASKETSTSNGQSKSGGQGR